MEVEGRHYRTIWLADDGRSVEIIDQTRLPHAFVVARLATVEEAADAIRRMRVRGAPLMGAAAAYGMALAASTDAADPALDAARSLLLSTRPTAINLRWALDEVLTVLRQLPPRRRAAAAWRRAAEICDEDVAINSAPVYKAHDLGIPVHVWVDETRPRNQGASLTAWELDRHGVPHTVIVDNAGGHLMQRGLVDLVIVGTDRTTRAGDVCNKIGTYLKALAAKDCGVPFYVALPGPTIDWTIDDGLAEIPIEARAAGEVTRITGLAEDGRLVEVSLTPDDSPARNDAFDVTPARLITGLITERGICAASAEELAARYPQRAR